MSVPVQPHSRERSFGRAVSVAKAESRPAIVGRDVRRVGWPGGHSTSALDWNLALIDIDMLVMDGIEGTRPLKALHPELTVVILTVFEEPAAILEAICAGADGYLLKKISPRELITQTRAVAKCGAPVTSGVARTVLDLLRTRSRPTGLRPKLEHTGRQQAVLRCLVPMSILIFGLLWLRPVS